MILATDDVPAGIDTGVRLYADDVRGLHDLLAGKGLDVGELLDWESAPLMFSFHDHDGNRFYVMQDD